MSTMHRWKKVIGAALVPCTLLAADAAWAAQPIVAEIETVIETETGTQRITATLERDSAGNMRMERAGEVQVLSPGQQLRTMVDAQLPSAPPLAPAPVPGPAAPASPSDMKPVGLRIVSDQVDLPSSVNGQPCALRRTVAEIPAGSIGNEEPVVLERTYCHSKKLDLLLSAEVYDSMSKRRIREQLKLKSGVKPKSNLLAVPAGKVLR